MNCVICELRIIIAVIGTREDEAVCPFLWYEHFVPWFSPINLPSSDSLQSELEDAF